MRSLFLMRFLFDENEWILQMAYPYIQNFLLRAGYSSDICCSLFWAFLLVFFPLNIMQNVMCGNLADCSGVKNAV